MTQAAYRQMVLNGLTDDGTVGAWRHRHPKIVVQQELMKEALLAHADIQPGMEVLDLASGTGDPAITIAGLVEDGHVTASDLSPAMLEACTEHAREAS